MLRAAEAGEIDIIVCEALDRLARDAEDVAWLGKKLGYHRVQLNTVSGGHVDEIKFAVAGPLGSIFLKHLLDETLRDQADRDQVLDVDAAAHAAMDVPRDPADQRDDLPRRAGRPGGRGGRESI